MSNFWNKRNMAIILILTIGFLFRLGGIKHGLPFSYYPDEQHFMNRALSFGTGDLNPHWFHKPALFMYLLFFEYGLFFLLGKLVGLFGSLQDFARLYINDKTIFLLIGRITITFFGMGMIFLTYRLGRKMYGKWVGLTAALMLACTFAHVKGCQDIKADVPAGFFTILSFFFIIRVLERGLRRDYILAGLCAGLGTATKYSPFILLIPLIFAHLFFGFSQGSVSWRKISPGNILLGLLFFGGGFFIGSPFNILDTYWIRYNVPSYFQSSAVTEILGEKSTVLGALSLIYSPLLNTGALILKTGSMGWALGALSIFGVAFLVWRHRHRDILILLMLFSFIYMAETVLRSYAEPRHLNVLYPFFCLAGAALVFQMVEMGSRKYLLSKPRAGYMLSLLVPILVVLPAAFGIVKYDYLISHKDTRSLAKEWVELNIPAGTKILVDDYCVPLKMTPARSEELLKKAEREEPGPFTAHAANYYRYYLKNVEEPTYHILEISHPWWKAEENEEGAFWLSSEYERDMGNPLKEWGVRSLDAYRDQGFRYLITTETLIQRYLDVPKGDRFPSFKAFYTDLESRALRIREFHPHPLHRPGPRVLLYSLWPEESR